MKRHLSKPIMWLMLLSVLFFSLNPTLLSPSTHGETGTIYIGVVIDFPPYLWQDQDGKIHGFYQDIIEHIKKPLEKQGYKIVEVPDQWANLVKKLDNDEIQLLPGMSITAERKQKYIFTTPLTMLKYRVYTVQHTYIKDLEGLKNPISPLTIGVLKGSSAEAYVKDNFPRLFIKEYPSIKDAISALLNKQIDLVMGYEHVVDFYLKNDFSDNKDIVYTLPIEFPGGTKWQAIAINKNHQDLSYQLDKILQEMAYKGTISELETKWFGIRTETPVNMKKIFYYIIFALLGIVAVAAAYHLQLANTTRRLRVAIKQKEDQKKQLEYQMNELMAAREELTAMGEQLMAQQEELTYLYENERTLKRQLEKQNEFLSTLLEFFRIPEEGGDFAVQLNNFLLKTKEAFEAEGAFLYKYLPDKNTLTLLAYSGNTVPKATVPPGIVQAFLLGKTTVLPASADPLATHIGVKEGTIFVVPLVVLKESKGILVLHIKKELSEHEKNNILTILENLAPSLGIYLENLMIIEAHLAETTNLKKLLQFIERSLTQRDVMTLLMESTEFATNLANADIGLLIDTEGNIIAKTGVTADELTNITEDIRDHIDVSRPETFIYDNKKNMLIIIYLFRIRTSSYKLVLMLHAPEGNIEKQNYNTYLLRLLVNFTSIYGSNIMYASTLEELVKQRAKESAILKGIVESMLRPTEESDPILSIVQIIEKSNIPVKLMKDGKVLYGQDDIPEVDRIEYPEENGYVIILGEKLPEHLKSTIKMWISVNRERIEWEKKLETSRAEWLGIIDSSPYPLVAIDGNGEISKVNKAFAELTGNSINDLLGKKLEDIMPNILKACTDHQPYNGWYCYEWVVDDISIGKILIKGESF